MKRKCKNKVKINCLFCLQPIKCVALDLIHTNNNNAQPYLPLYLGLFLKWSLEEYFQSWISIVRVHILPRKLNVVPNSYLCCIFGPAFCIGQWLYCKWVTSFATFNDLSIIWVSLLLGFHNPAGSKPEYVKPGQQHVVKLTNFCVIYKAMENSGGDKKAKQTSLLQIFICWHIWKLVLFVIT